MLSGLGLEVWLLKPLSKPQLVHFSIIQLVHSPKWIKEKQSSSWQTNYPQTCDANGSVVLALLVRKKLFEIRLPRINLRSGVQTNFLLLSPVSSTLSQKLSNQPQAIKINQQEVCLWLKWCHSCPIRDLHSCWVQKVTGWQQWSLGRWDHRGSRTVGSLYFMSAHFVDM